nr:hypothetical protein [Tanacetum cinerariifolium]
MLIFSRTPLFLWAEAIATTCFTQNRSIIHRRFNKTPYELINGRKPDISFLHVFGALCYPKNNREDIGKLGAKGDVGFFIGYSADSCAYRIYNSQTKKIMETMNVSFDELSAMAFEQRSSKPGLKKIMETMNVTFDEFSAMAFEQNSSRPGLQSMTSGQISSELELTYAPSIITPQRPSERDLDILFEPLHNEYLGGQPLKAPRTIPTASVLQNLQGPTTSMSIQDSAPTPTNSLNTPVSSHNVDVPSQQHAQQQRNLTPSPTAFAADNVPNAVLEGDLFVNPLPHLPLSTVWVKQAPRAWYDELFTFLLQNGFSKGTIDLTLFTRRFDDDILVVNQSPSGIFINQSNYVNEILKKYGLNTCDIIGTPMDIKDKLELDQIRTPVDATKYHSMIGALMYLTSSRPDIVHATCVCARYQAHPTEKHLKEVKKIFRY